MRPVGHYLVDSIVDIGVSLLYRNPYLAHFTEYKSVEFRLKNMFADSRKYFYCTWLFLMRSSPIRVRMRSAQGGRMM